MNTSFDFSITMNDASGLPLSNQNAGKETVSLQLAEFVDSIVREALAGVRNGQITITVCNGEIVQIDRILKNRPFKFRRRA